MSDNENIPSKALLDLVNELCVVMGNHIEIYIDDKEFPLVPFIMNAVINFTAKNVIGIVQAFSGNDNQLKFRDNIYKDIVNGTLRALKSNEYMLLLDNK